MEAAQHYNNNSNSPSMDDKNDLSGDEDSGSQHRLSSSVDASSDDFRSSSIAALRARAQQHSAKLHQQHDQHHHSLQNQHNLVQATQDIWNSVARIGQEN